MRQDSFLSSRYRFPYYALRVYTHKGAGGVRKGGEGGGGETQKSDGKEREIDRQTDY